ncbi:ATP-binding protein [Parasphingorhabdus pacifica]
MTNRAFRPPRLSLTRYLLLAITVLLVVTLTAAGALWTAHEYRDARAEYRQRAMTMAQSVAALPEVRDYLADPRHHGEIASLAETLRRASDFRYVVIVDADGIRHSHPDPRAIGGRPHTDPTPVLAGNTWTGVEWGPAGLTLRARVPVRDVADNVVGYVSVGVLSSRVTLAASNTLPAIGTTLLFALVVGAVGALWLSRKIRAKTHGLEPGEITELLESREALLYAINEGVLAVGADGTVLLANDSAREMFALPADCIGRTPRELGLDEQLRDVLRGADPREDVFLSVGGRLLVCNHRPVRIDGQGTGRLVTSRDHTELVRLGGELDGVRTMANGLRAQTHEFANRIHTVTGMLDLGAVTAAREYLSELSATTTQASTSVSEHVHDTTLAALVLAKSAQASEQGVEFELAAFSDVPDELPPQLRHDVLLVVGNLVDNAFDAVGESGWVELLVRLHREAAPLLEIRVTDSGPGISPEVAGDVFTAGASTKDHDGPGHRGLGLALVRQSCERWHGWVEVDTTEETVFSAHLPVREDAH